MQNTYYRDADTDTYGNSAVNTQACTAPSGYVSNNTDCDDSNVQINPSVTEKCDGIDNNCNLQTDEDFPDLGSQCAVGFGACMNTGTKVCTGDGLGTVCNATPLTPMPEVCDGLDNNCDGDIDEGVGTTYYADTDGDCYGNVLNPMQICGAVCQACGCPSLNNTDCDDTNPSIHPGAIDDPNDGIDQDCSGGTSNLINISTRGMVQTGDNVMIGGFIISGSTPRSVLIRGFGPTLADFGVTGAMANPYIDLYFGQTLIATNDNWQTPIAQCDAPAVSCGTPQDIQDTGKSACSVASTGCTQDAAILVTLPPGAYTAIVRGVNNGTGVGLVGIDEIVP